MSDEIRTTKRQSIKSRMLAIVLIPSLALLLVGLAISGFLVAQGIQTYRWASGLQAAVGPGTRIVGDLQIERWLSLVQVGGGQVPQATLAAQRAKVDADVASIRSTASTTPELTGIVSPSGALASPWDQLSTVRQQVDSGGITLLDAYSYYDQLLSPISSYVGAIAGQAPNGQIAGAQLTAAALYGATEDVARANAVSFAAAIRGGMTNVEFAEYARQVGAYQSALASLSAQMTPSERSQYNALVASPAWQQLTDVQNTLSARGPTLTDASSAAPLAVSQLDWQNDTIHVTAEMLGLFDSHFQYAADLAATDGRNTLIRALIAGLVIILAGIAVLIIAMRMSGGVVRRLGRLRRETLDLADEHLPRIVEQLRAGGRVDVGAQMPVLHHGQDEIGQVAEAFNKAQHTAVAAAVQEAQTRQGANAVFLNIAHRSQIVAHRQLGVLDLAERRQDDPQQVQFLFQLDHLATRARRNAENLIILGGERPARQWRDAVPLRDVVRSAIAETEHFARIKIVRLPPVAVAGRAVADVVHLLAELLDNATAFAPPAARAEVTGNLVGRGAVIEIEDQGLGIPPEMRDALNAGLRTPPDYGVMTLTSDARLGLFVVARLAARHDIRITLADSIYGGTRAVVVLPATLIEVDGVVQPLESDDDAMAAIERSANQVDESRLDNRPDNPIDDYADQRVDQQRVDQRVDQQRVDQRPVPAGDRDVTPMWPPVEARDPAIDSGPATEVIMPVTNGHNGHIPDVLVPGPAATNGYPHTNGHPTNGGPANGGPVAGGPSNGHPGNGHSANGYPGNGHPIDGNDGRPTVMVPPVAPPNDRPTVMAPPVPAPNGVVPASSTPGDPPPLPRRQRQASLAPQLTTSSFVPPDARQVGSRTADQVRNAATAFQRGTHRARDTDSNVGDDNGVGDTDGGSGR